MPQISAMTETAVANEALGHLRLTSITNLDTDTSNKGATLKRVFGSVRDTMQARYPWNFCEEYKTLNILPDVTPAFRFKYSYALPNDPWCLTARDLEGCDDRRQWKVQGRRLVTNIGPTVNLIYTKRNTDVSEWSALFRAAFALGLASACPELCKDKATIDEVIERAQAALDAAFPVDAGEGTLDELPEQDIILARGAGCRGPRWLR